MLVTPPSLPNSPGLAHTGPSHILTSTNHNLRSVIFHHIRVRSLSLPLSTAWRVLCAVYCIVRSEDWGELGGKMCHLSVECGVLKWKWRNFQFFLWDVRLDEWLRHHQTKNTSSVSLNPLVRYSVNFSILTNPWNVLIFITESAYIYVKVGLCWNCFMQRVYSLFILIERFSQHLNESRNHSDCSWFTWISNKARQEEEWLDVKQTTPPQPALSPLIEFEQLCVDDCSILTWVQLTVIRLVGNSFLTGPVCLYCVAICCSRASQGWAGPGCCYGLIIEWSTLMSRDSPDTALSLVELYYAAAKVYAITTQVKAWYGMISGFHAQKESIIGDYMP